jgi:hypothetical protein
VCLVSTEMEKKVSTDSLWYNETAFLMLICVGCKQNTAQILKRIKNIHSEYFVTYNGCTFLTIQYCVF